MSHHRANITKREIARQRRTLASLGGEAPPDEAFLARWELDEAGFRLYDADGNLVVNLSADDGSGTFKGEIRTGSKIIGTDLWMPSDDPAQSRTRLFDTDGPGVGGLFFYKGGETSYRSGVWVGESNVNMYTKEPSSTRTCTAEVRHKDSASSDEPIWIAFLTRAIDTVAQPVWFRRAGAADSSGEVNLYRVNQMPDLEMARKLVQEAVYTLTYPGGSVETSALSITFAAAFAATPTIVPAGRGTSGTSHKTLHCVGVRSATGCDIVGTMVDGTSPANGTTAAGSLIAVNGGA